MHHPFDLALPHELEDALEKQIAAMDASGTVDRIWQKDASVWTGAGEEKWLGWLDITERELDRLETYAPIASSAGEFRDVVLLGMGGSSLCPDVLSKVFSKNGFQVLDSTVPDQVLTLDAAIDPAETLFIVASKSGTTLEPNIFFDHYFDLVSRIKGPEKAGENFVAITDPGSSLARIAEARGFRHVFLGDPEIGGRFSALSSFGIAPAAAMGLDIGSILERADNLAGASRRGSVVENAAAFLGCLLGTAQKTGRDKLEILASDSIVSFGAWLEQLIAESTGKGGKAIIPVDLRGVPGSPPGRKDRVLVYLKDPASASPEHDRYADSLAAADEAVIRLDLSDKEEIGAEFFRWEFATAVAGSVMEINPFDQPDVESAKVEARKITDEYEATGALPEEKEIFEGDGMKFFADTANRVVLGDHDSAAGLLRSHIERIAPGDYAAILAYVEMNDENAEILEKMRSGIAVEKGVSAGLQFGPRFLHSTGQAFKGGPNSGVFIQISADDSRDTPIPDRAITFGVVKEAQARGDFQVLLERERRALRIHLEGNAADGLKRLAALLG